MTIATFPALPGQGIRVLKTAKFDTRISRKASGSELRSRNFGRPLFRFELAFDGLSSHPTAYPGLGNRTVQTLEAFWLAMRGPLIPFFYVDPTDHIAVGRQIGTGDGSTLTFVLTHGIGAWSAPVDAASVSVVKVNGVIKDGWTMSGPNSITFSNDGYHTPPAGSVITADYTYAYYVRFSDDVLDFEEFMSMLVTCKTVKLQSVRQRATAWGGMLVTIVLTTAGGWPVPGGVTILNRVQAYGGGAGGQAGCEYAFGTTTLVGGQGGGGGGYSGLSNIAVTPGVVLPVTAGGGGLGQTGTATTSIFGGASSIILPGGTTVAGEGGGYSISTGASWQGGGGATGYGGIYSSGGIGGQIDFRTSTATGGCGGGGGGGPNGYGGGGAGYPYPYMTTTYGGCGAGAGNGGGTGSSWGGDASGTMGGSPPSGGSGGAGGVSAYGGGAGGAGGNIGGAGGAGADGEITEAVDGRFYGSAGGGGGGGAGSPGGAGGTFGGGGGGGGAGAAGGRGGNGAVLITYPYAFGS